MALVFIVVLILVSVLGDYPMLKANPVLKYRDYIRRDVSSNDSLEVKPLPVYMRELISKSNKVVYMNLSYHSVINQMPFINDTLGYYDELYLNAYGSRKLINYLDKDLILFFRKEGIIK